MNLYKSVRFLTAHDRYLFESRYSMNKSISNAIANVYGDGINPFILERDPYGNTKVFCVDVASVNCTPITHTELKLFTTFGNDTEWSTTPPFAVGYKANEPKLATLKEALAPDENQANINREPINVPVQKAKVKTPTGVSVTEHVHINKTISTPKKAKELIKFLQDKFGV